MAPGAQACPLRSAASSRPRSPAASRREEKFTASRWQLAAGLSSGGEENAAEDNFGAEYELEGAGGEGSECSSTKEDLKDVGLRQGTRLKGAKAREWFSKQLMLPEWMIDIPHRLKIDWSLLLNKKLMILAVNWIRTSALWFQPSSLEKDKSIIV